MGAGWAGRFVRGLGQSGTLLPRCLSQGRQHLPLSHPQQLLPQRFAGFLLIFVGPKCVPSYGPWGGQSVWGQRSPPVTPAVELRSLGSWACGPRFGPQVGQHWGRFTSATHPPCFCSLCESFLPTARRKAGGATLH